MKLPTLRVVFNYRNKINISGMYPIHLRITIARNTKFIRIPTPQNISEIDWNLKNKGDYYVKNSHPYYFEINEKIVEYKTKVQSIISRYYRHNKNVTFDILFSHLKNSKSTFTFNDFANLYIKNPKEKFEIATITKYKSFLKHLNAFNSNINFSEITPELVTNFKKYLEVDLNLLGSTTKSYFDKFKKIIIQAERESFLDYHQTRFLFTDAKIKVNKAKRTYLEIEEILKLKNLEIDEQDSHFLRDRDMFLFQIYTGLYYNDLRILKKENLKEHKGVGKYLIAERDKNGNTAVIPLYKFDNALELIAPYLSEDNSLENLFDSAFFIQDQVYNRQLKMIAKKAGIKKDISNKVARHTNVQLWIRYGAERPIISKMVGHSKESTTEEYFDVFALDVFEGTKNVNFKELGL